jgi:hypothetical protein
MNAAPLLAAQYKYDLACWARDMLRAAGGACEDSLPEVEAKVAETGAVLAALTRVAPSTSGTSEETMAPFAARTCPGEDPVLGRRVPRKKRSLEDYERVLVYGTGGTAPARSSGALEWRGQKSRTLQVRQPRTSEHTATCHRNKRCCMR